MKKRLYYPKWFFPKNLGDSCVFAALPKFIKTIYPTIELEVVTTSDLVDICLLDPNVTSARVPYGNEIRDYYFFSSYAKEYNLKESTDWVIFPENNAKLFKTLGEHFEAIVAHPSLNFIVVNFLLQLNIPIEIILELPDIFGLQIPIEIPNQKFSLAICPMTKTNGKPSPHPSCNGKGFRFNGDKGIDSWKELVSIIKTQIDVDVYEFSPVNLDLGDFHIGFRNSLYDLYRESASMDYAITTDGGYHHLFNLSRKPLTLFTGTKVTKPEFMQLGNAYVPPVHLDCRKTCASFYSDIFPVEDKSLTCNLECENVNPTELAYYCIEDIKYVRDNRISRR